MTISRANVRFHLEEMVIQKKPWKLLSFQLKLKERKRARKAICVLVERLFGHRVDWRALEELIESSPIVKK
jgi:hypothetical protein